MRIDTSTWKWFVIEDLFDKFETGKGHDTLLDDGEECFYLGAKKSDNGIMRKCAVNESMLQDGNCIVFICNGAGSVGYANYMDRPFIATTDLVLGYADWLNEKTGLFVATVLCKERFKYSFGRKWKTHLRDTQIKLPATPDGKPDWQWMESYIDSLHSKALTSANAVGNGFRLNTEDWREFLLADYFDIVPGKYHYPDEYEEGNTPYYSATNENNGIAQNISLKPDFSGNCIVTGKIGCTAFYVPDDFCATSDVNIFKPKFCMTPYIGLFVASVINLSENYKWAYGRQCRVGNSKKIRIKLPATPDGKPDWQRMENYIKSLPYGDRL